MSYLTYVYKRNASDYDPPGYKLHWGAYQKAAFYG